MRIEVNGVRIFFDVEGAKLVPDGPRMREQPTLILLHGGPGMDHSGYKPAFSRFADIAQVVYIDHRGNGRSNRQPAEAWTLAQWGDDLFEFCRALEIEKPIVLGNSFGGFVAIAYATRHPEHPGKLILSSTAAQGHAHVERSIELFDRAGGPEIAAMARHALTIGYDSPEFALKWMTEAMPFYNTVAKPDPDARARSVMSGKVLMSFLGPGGEGLSFDMLADLAKVRCPTLVLGGEADPITPIESQEDIARALPPHLVRFERFASAGHGIFRDDPRGLDVIREFVVSSG
ncbi:MAG: alpha/beta fold hydrolase [Chloroflexi bacterium]|nr:alpha/beta fold hydrolase [Chloroflexota bacterium]